MPLERRAVLHHMPCKTTVAANDSDIDIDININININIKQ